MVFASVTVMLLLCYVMLLLFYVTNKLDKMHHIRKLKTGCGYCYRWGHTYTFSTFYASDSTTATQLLKEALCVFSEEYNRMFGCVSWAPVIQSKIAYASTWDDVITLVKVKRATINNSFIT